MFDEHPRKTIKSEISGFSGLVEHQFFDLIFWEYNIYAAVAQCRQAERLTSIHEKQ
jgi:hypothetical protein